MGVQYAKETEDRGENKTKHNVINSIASLNTFVVQLMDGCTVCQRQVTKVNNNNNNKKQDECTECQRQMT